MSDQDATQEPTAGKPSQPRAIRRAWGRHVIVLALVTLIVGGQVVAVARSEEYWPFSPYPMYSELQQEREYTVIRLVAVRNDGREVPLDSAWLRKWMGRLSRRDNAEEELRRAMAKYVRKYGWKRPSDPRGSAPKLKALRAYEQHWELTHDAGNAPTPDRTRLLAEIRRGKDGGINGL